MQILFIHGRAQEEFSQEILLRIWAEALRASFENANIPFPENLNLTLPYYGKDLIHQRDLYKQAIKDGKFKMRSPNNVSEFDEVYEDLLEELRKNSGISKKEVAQESGETEQYRGLTNNKHVIALARLVDRRLDSLGNFCVKWKTDDVVTYLVVEAARQEINSFHTSAITKEPTIIISHSLGTVIAYDILHTLAENQYDIRGLVTLGSPLGVQAVQRQLYPCPSYPKILNGQWVNIYDPKDIVALNPLNNKNFRVTPQIINHEIENNSDNHHDIKPYLSSPVVAETIYTILTSACK
ncbi:hypothetical protein WH221_06870 [Chryseobacterium culicis]|uniref:Alpha/beta hydrolase n=1 Tax=Chryseobacterium culicis TaxID=680127 RepID=A0A2S9CZS1_CHRCI|nr:hypothetical protein [Chryseobacterium culicis]PRB85961.1 hypothetical protein CQ022_06845 [Chryseobacterium culicis]PRB91714.1 hypothetical protein CQ033_00515 [Chryseobacterium culicis]